MKQLDLLILRELVGPFLNSVFMFLSVLFATSYLFSITEMLTNGVPVVTVLRIVMLSLPVLVTQTLPMSMLLGSLLAFGRISSDSEHIAMYAGGISFYRALAPVVVMGLVVSVTTFAWNETVVPPAQREFLRLRQEVGGGLVTSGRPLRYDLKNGDYVTQIVNVHGGYDKETGWFRKVMMVKLAEEPERQGQLDLYVFAERARPLSGDPSGLDWQYEDVRVWDLRPNPQGYQVDIHFDELTTGSARRTLGADIMGRTFTGVMQAQRPDNRSMTFRELRDKIRSERRAGNLTTLVDEMDLWEKVSLPLASLIFGLVGAPLGIRPQRGSKAMGFGVAIAIIFLYWVVYRWMYVVGQSGALPPILASFTACILGLVAAVVLAARTRQ